MFRMTKLTDYGIVLLTQFASARGPAPRSPRASSRTETRLPLPTVGKLLKQLSHGGLLASQRGTKGGYALARPPREITVASIIEALEGPVAITECDGPGASASTRASAPTKPNWQVINDDDPRRSLEGLTLADMTRPARAPALAAARSALPRRSRRRPGAPRMSDEPLLDELTQQEYQHGFVTDIESDVDPGRASPRTSSALISKKKDEPEWLLEWRLKAYRHWLTMEEPTWAKVHYPPIDYQKIVYYSAPKSAEGRPEEPRRRRPGAPRDVREARRPAQGARDPRRRRRRRRHRQRVRRDDVPREARVARHHLLLLLRGRARAPRPRQEVPRHRSSRTRDNFFATLNSAVFSDGSFCYIPKGVRCPMELSTYFRINQADTGQFERTLIVAEEGASVVATSRAARRRSATRTSSTRPSSSSSRSTTRRSSTRPSRTGTPATRRARAASTTS